MHATLPQHDVVLLGVGHTNAHVLRMWRMQPPRGARLTCVSNYPIATYSGMLPGVLAENYRPEQMEIDLVRLCAAVGARLIVGNVTGLDVAGQALQFADRPPLPFDVLSVGIGSVPSRKGLDHSDATVLAVKPMQTFPARLRERLAALQADEAGRTRRVLIVGGGVGGAEISFCLSHSLRREMASGSIEIALVDSHDRLVDGMSQRTSSLVQRRLEERGVTVQLNKRVRSVSAGVVTLDGDERLSADVVIWVTSAAPPPLLASFDLPKDEEGFLLTHPTLQTTAGAPIFAVGDSGTMAGVRTPKAGVYAVRQGPILWENIEHMLAGQPLIEYQPQRGFLKLMNLGDGRSIGEYKGVTLEGRWAWWLKDRIDRKFMAMYQDYQPSAMDAADGDALEAVAKQIRCAGCGGKVGGSILSRALGRLHITPNEHVVVGLGQPDDAAVIQSPGGGPLTVTTDFFAAPLDDPYLVGRMAAEHAASDALAKGARPIAALAMATIPPGSARQQEQLLFELLAGGVEVLQKLGATLVGGHTIEGPQLQIGYTILADQRATAFRAKGSLQVGDRLVLTKPLGVGVLLAAHMQARLKAAWLDPLLRTMLTSNSAAAFLDGFDLRGATDVTGFGLAGHLLEMLRAANVSAELQLQNIALLPGAEELLAEGLESTLAPANRVAQTEIEASDVLRRSPRYAALFDPQTCGGLLFGVPPDKIDVFLARLQQTTNLPAQVIGSVTERRGSSIAIHVTQ